MDDGKCLLDVISDPQALKEFFRSSSQIAFVDGSISPVNDESLKIKETSNFNSHDVTRSSKPYSNQETEKGYQISTEQNGSPHNNVKTGKSSSVSTVNNENISLANPIANNMLGISSTQAGGTGLGAPLSHAYVTTGHTILPSVSVRQVSVSPKQNVNSQIQLQTPARHISSPQATIRPQTIKGSPLPILRPKGVAGSAASQVAIQGNIMTQGLRTSPMKGQPQLVAIRPKIVVAQSTTGSQSNLGLTNTFTPGSKGSPQLTKQVLGTLTVPQLKQAVSNQTIGKTGLANLVQLQPKQIAPKPEQMLAGKAGNIKQDNLQLVQSILANNQTSTKDIKVTTQEGLTAQQKAAQQNQLKILLQQNPLVQQALQARVQLQPQSVKQQPSLQQPLTQLTKVPAQNLAVYQNKTPLSTGNQTNQQTKHQVINTTQQSMSTANLANQLKEAINSKQLQQFLEKNPIVAQQLKQLNMRQTALASGTRPQGFGSNTVSTTGVKLAISQAPQIAASITRIDQCQVVKDNVNESPSLAIGQLQKPLVLTKSVPSTIAQKSNTLDTTQKSLTANVIGQSVAKTPVSIQSAGKAITLQKPDIKPVTTQQKVVIVQNSNAGSTQTVAAGETKVLLQTKEGRPILISQEQFRQIQAQLASKNLSIQGKLVTASPVTTTATTGTKPQVVVKSETSLTAKTVPKVVSLSSKTANIKQETKSTKRPAKAVETQESKLAKRLKLSLQKDQNEACIINIHKTFKSQEDAIARLTPYHVFSEPCPNARMQSKANTLLDKLAQQLTNKGDKMMNKYRQLILKDMQRDVPSAEVVMMNRIFLADEKAALIQRKQTVLQEAKKFAQATKATLHQLKTNPKSSNPSTETSTMPTLDEDLRTNTALTPIEIINDDDSSPITSANSFLTHITHSNSYNNQLSNALEPG